MANNTSDPTKDARPFTMIDGYSLSLSQGTGIATYARGLAHALKSMDHRVGVLYGHAKHREQEAINPESASGPNTRNARSSRIARIWRRNIVTSLALISNPTLRFPAKSITIAPSQAETNDAKKRATAADCFNVNRLYDIAEQQFSNLSMFTTVEMIPPPERVHWTYPLPVRISGARNIYTIHDLIPLRLPSATLDNKARYFSLMKRIAETADHILTVSENSKRDIVELLNVPEQKITNTYQSVCMPAANPIKAKQEIPLLLQREYNLEYKNYYLFYGAIEPKKNINRLVQAFISTNTEAPLVIAGPRAWGAECLRLIDRVVAGEFGNRVRYLGYLRINQLTKIIQGAKATLFPSLYEGFGLPVVESMLLGTPVITSNTSSLPEIAGDAAIKVSPYRVGDIKAAIQAIDTNVALRRELTAKGSVRAEHFNNENFITRLASIHRSC